LFIVLAWHTMVNVTLFITTIAFMKDPHTLFKCIAVAGTGGELHRRKRASKPKAFHNALYLSALS
jgi:hypothetical protein